MASGRTFAREREVMLTVSFECRARLEVGERACCHGAPGRSSTGRLLKKIHRFGRLSFRVARDQRRRSGRQPTGTWTAARAAGHVMSVGVYWNDPRRQ